MVTKLDLYNILVDSLSWEWNDFKKALLGIDKGVFDSLIRYAKQHPQGLKYAYSTPFVPIIISVLLEQEKSIHELWNNVKPKNYTEKKDISILSRA